MLREVPRLEPPSCRFSRVSSREWLLLRNTAPARGIKVSKLYLKNNAELTAQLRRRGTREQAIHIGLELGPIPLAAEHPPPHKQGTDHHVSGGKPSTEEVGTVAQFAFD